MSLIINSLVGANWPSPAKQLSAFLICIIGAFIPIVVSGVELTNLAVVLPLMWIGSQVFYKAWFKPSGIAPWIETLFLNNTAPQPVAARFDGPHDTPYIRDYDDQFHP
jgi:hypothetical protein